jgi:hypothetical protein
MEHLAKEQKILYMNEAARESQVDMFQIKKPEV